jgi:hypothetical protein
MGSDIIASDLTDLDRWPTAVDPGLHGKGECEVSVVLLQGWAGKHDQTKAYVEDVPIETESRKILA